MNVARSTQLELLLLSKTLDIIKSTPGLSIAKFFQDFIVAIEKLPEGSLSAYWKELEDTRESLVDVKPSDTVDGADTIVPNIAELDHLRKPLHMEIRHDPILVIRSLYEAASSSLLAASPEEKSSLLYSCLTMGEKSARTSLLTHAIALMYIFKDETPGIKAKILKTIAKRGKEIYAESRSSEKEKCAKSSSSSSREMDSLDNIRQNLVYSFGKADHGNHFSAYLVLCCFVFNIFLLVILGKLGLGDAQLNRLIPTSVEALKEKSIIRIASMSTYCLALSSSGTVYIWGVGGSVGTMPSSKTDITPQIFDALPLRMKIMDISCGLGHALFLTNFGRVFSWGSGGNGRLGVGDTIDRTEACLVTGLCSELIVSVTCGASHSLAITSKGQIYSWGKNSQGQNGIGNVEDTLKPVLVKKLAEKFVIQVAAGWEHTLALTNDGKMYSWGCGYKDNKRGTVPPVLGLGNSECKASPELITSIETIRIIVVACGWDHCLALDSDGKVLSWGSGQNGEFNVSFLFVILLFFALKVNSVTEMRKTFLFLVISPTLKTPLL
jgi:hypothetical protein